MKGFPDADPHKSPYGYSNPSEYQISPDRGLIFDFFPPSRRLVKIEITRQSEVAAAALLSVVRVSGSRCHSILARQKEWLCTIRQASDPLQNLLEWMCHCFM